MKKTRSNEELLCLLTQQEREAFDAYCRYRTQRGQKDKKPFGENAVRRALLNVVGLREAGQDVRKCLLASIKNGWLGIFSVKGNRKPSVRQITRVRGVTLLDVVKRGRGVDDEMIDMLHEDWKETQEFNEMVEEGECEEIAWMAEQDEKWDRSFGDGGFGKKNGYDDERRLKVKTERKQAVLEIDDLEMTGEEYATSLYQDDRLRVSSWELGLMMKHATKLHADLRTPLRLYLSDFEVWNFKNYKRAIKAMIDAEIEYAVENVGMDDFNTYAERLRETRAKYWELYTSAFDDAFLRQLYGKPND